MGARFELTSATTSKTRDKSPKAWPSSPVAKHMAALSSDARSRLSGRSRCCAGACREAKRAKRSRCECLPRRGDQCCPPVVAPDRSEPFRTSCQCAGEFFFLYASALQGREHYGVGTTRARSCTERAGRTVRGTMKLVRRSRGKSVMAVTMSTVPRSGSALGVVRGPSTLLPPREELSATAGSLSKKIAIYKYTQDRPPVELPNSVQ